MASSIGPASLYLADLIEVKTADAANTLYQVQFAFGPPDQYEENEVVALLGVTDLAEQSRVLGPQPNVRDENYSIDLAVKAYLPAGTSREAWDRGFDMYQAVREIVLLPANQKLNNTVMWALPFPRDVVLNRPDGEDGKRLPGWVIRIDMGIACKARA